LAIGVALGIQVPAENLFAVQTAEEAEVIGRVRLPLPLFAEEEAEAEDPVSQEEPARQQAEPEAEAEIIHQADLILVQEEAEAAMVLGPLEVEEVRVEPAETAVQVLAVTVERVPMTQAEEAEAEPTVIQHYLQNLCSVAEEDQEETEPITQPSIQVPRVE
jgi:hypothetical protein